MHIDIRIWVVPESRNILIPPSGVILREEEKEEDGKKCNIVLRSQSAQHRVKRKSLQLQQCIVVQCIAVGPEIFKETIAA